MKKDLIASATARVITIPTNFPKAHHGSTSKLSKSHSTKSSNVTNRYERGHLKETNLFCRTTSPEVETGC